MPTKGTNGPEADATRAARDAAEQAVGQVADKAAGYAADQVMGRVADSAVRDVAAGPPAAGTSHHLDSLIDQYLAAEAGPTPEPLIDRGLGMGLVVAGVVLGFVGNPVAAGLTLGAGAVYHSLLYRRDRARAERREVHRHLEGIRALYPLAADVPTARARLADLLHRLESVAAGETIRAVRGIVEQLSRAAPARAGTATGKATDMPTMDLESAVRDALDRVPPTASARSRERLAAGVRLQHQFPDQYVAFLDEWAGDRLSRRVLGHHADLADLLADLDRAQPGARDRATVEFVPALGSAVVRPRVDLGTMEAESPEAVRELFAWERSSRG
jgi:hypothetical protein